MSGKLLYEIFDEFEQRESKEDKIAVLRCNYSQTLGEVLRGTFDPNIQFSISVPEYKPSDSPVGLGFSTIHQEIKRAYLFERNNPKVSPTLTEQRKKEILTQILESLEAKEAKVFAGMIMKKQEVSGLTYELVKEAFPHLLP